MVFAFEDMRLHRILQSAPVPNPAATGHHPWVFGCRVLGARGLILYSALLHYTRLHDTIRNYTRLSILYYNKLY